MATSQLRAKLGAVKQNLSDLCGPRNSTEQQQMGISQAVMACNEIFNLFQDTDYVFYQSPMSYIMPLLSFAAVHKTVLTLAKKSMPSVYGPNGSSGNPSSNKEAELKSLVQVYIGRFKQERFSENVIFARIVNSIEDVAHMQFSDFQALMSKVPRDAAIIEFIVDRCYPEKKELKIKYCGGSERSDYKDRLWTLYNSEFNKILNYL